MRRNIDLNRNVYTLFRFSSTGKADAKRQSVFSTGQPEMCFGSLQPGKRIARLFGDRGSNSRLHSFPFPSNGKVYSKVSLVTLNQGDECGSFGSLQRGKCIARRSGSDMSTTDKAGFGSLQPGKCVARVLCFMNTLWVVETSFNSLQPGKCVASHNLLD